MKSSTSLEPKFFAYILENPNYFHKVEPISFKNTEIRFVYERVRDYYLTSKNHIVPSNPKIRDLVRIDDPSGKISDQFLKALLSVDISEYNKGAEDDWLRDKLQSICTTTNIKSRISEASDFIRNIDPLDNEEVEKVASKIREIFSNATLLNFDDDDLGMDFDTAESHIQDSKRNKIPTGWPSLTELLEGGWDLKTLNMIIGPSNSGKSLWLTNIAASAANHGKNVLYISLEMSEKKILKRIGANRLEIPIYEYDEKSKDVNYVEKKIKKLRSSNSSLSSDSDLFDSPMGKIYVREFPSGTANVADIENYVKNVEEKKGFKVDMVIVDYLTIMSPDNKQGTLFSNGKQLAEGLRAIAQKMNLCMVSAMQVGKDNFGASDINLADIAESKAIVETADVMFGIIRTEVMRRNKQYQLKLLKMRDGDFKWEKTQFDLNTKYLRIEKDVKLDYNN